MKKYLIIILLLIAGASYAQPVIDSMLIDEMKSELHIYGAFGSQQGKVSVDSIDMQVKSWSDSLITTSIPDSGKGAAGPVIVEALGKRSVPRLITMWKGSYYHFVEEAHSRFVEYSNSFGFIARLDLYSLLKNIKNVINPKFTPCKSTFYSTTYATTRAYDPQFGYDVSYEVNSILLIQATQTNYQKGFLCTGHLDMAPRTFNFYVSNIKGIQEHITFFRSPLDSIQSDSIINYPVENTEIEIKLDSVYNIVHFSLDSIYPFGSSTEKILIGGSVLFLPEKLISLEKKPTLLFPTPDTSYSNRNKVVLFWDSLSLMTGYHLQVSPDSQFATSIIDTTILQTSFALPDLTGLTKYFWRVSGINSEGESRWSDVWNFTTGSNADVKEKNNSILILSSYPNPSSNELNISCTLPSMSPARILLYNLQGNVCRESTVTGSDNVIKWNISDLANGMYILGLITEFERITKMVTVLH